MNIYQTHHKRNAEVAALSELSSEEIARQITEGELGRGKKIVRVNSFRQEVAKSVQAIRDGKCLHVLGIDFPDTALETDPICKNCKACSRTMSSKEVEEFYSKSKIKE